MLSPKQNIIFFEVAYCACCRSLWVLGIQYMVLFTLITLTYRKRSETLYMKMNNEFLWLTFCWGSKIADSVWNLFLFCYVKFVGRTYERLFFSTRVQLLEVFSGDFDKLIGKADEHSTNVKKYRKFGCKNLPEEECTKFGVCSSYVYNNIYLNRLKKTFNKFSHLKYKYIILASRHYPT